MKKILAIVSLVAGLGFSNAQATNTIQKTETQAKERVAQAKKVESKAKETKQKAQIVEQKAEAKLKKDGTPDRRYKENKKLKKDGTPDKRYKEK